MSLWLVGYEMHMKISGTQVHLGEKDIPLWHIPLVLRG